MARRRRRQRSPMRVDSDAIFVERRERPKGSRKKSHIFEEIDLPPSPVKPKSPEKPTASTSLSSQSPSKFPIRAIPNLLDIGSSTTEVIGEDYIGQGSETCIPESGGSGGKSQNDMMREWLPKRQEFLRCLLQLEEARRDSKCSECSAAMGTWRCENCFGMPLYCTGCCRRLHMKTPFHRVQRWTGAFFRPAWLWSAGVHLAMGHGGNECPGNPWMSGAQGMPEFNVVDDGADDDEEEEELDIPHNLFDPPPKKDMEGNPMMVIVDTSGIHHIGVRWCGCTLPGDRWEQLLELGLYPASVRNPRTAFTFRVLDDFLIENKECKTAALAYYSKLKRITNNGFPQIVVDRYRELIRVSRQWRNLKHRKWHGYGNAPDEAIAEGGLCYFCPACPQPGINVSNNYQHDPLLKDYVRAFIMDGNFKAEHMKMRNAHDDVSLGEGEEYMVDGHMYKAHLAIAKDAVDRSTCNDHKAVNAVNASRSHLDATGVGATACARHGCFVPSSVVDFQKGERQMNMDYSLSQAFKSLRGMNDAIVMYDISCQYSKNLTKRFTESPHLTWPENLKVTYASHFIPGAGELDGEIIETLWAPLNHISGSTRGMSAAHRREVVNDHMGDSNWKKLTGIVTSLLRKWKRVDVMLNQSKNAFNIIDSTLDSQRKAAWTSNAEAAHHARVLIPGTRPNPEKMDIFDVQRERAPGKDVIQLELTMKEQTANGLKGSAMWLATGLKIQEAQLSLAASVRGKGPRPTVSALLQIEDQRQRLQQRIDNWVRKADQFLSNADGMPISIDTADTSTRRADKDLEESWDEFQFDESDAQNPDVFFGERPDADNAEDIALGFPSVLGTGECRRLGLHSLMEQELQLRYGQANDALHILRLSLGYKSFLFRSSVRTADSHREKLRSFDEVGTVERTVREHARLYSRARQAMLALDAPADVMTQYRVLKRDDLKVTTSLIHPNAHGLSGANLSWIWGADVRGDAQNAEWMEEFYRVNWLRTKARFDRCSEMKAILQAEMACTTRWFAFRAEEWERRMANAPEGRRCYAAKQRWLWRSFHDDAKTRFRDVIPTLEL